MTRNTIIFLLLTITICTPELIFGQDSLTTKNLTLIIGKWKLCGEANFSVDYKCVESFAEYTFDNKGGFAENHYGSSCTGSYKLNDNHFSCKCDDKDNTIYGRLDYQIFWLDKDHFYHIYNPEGKGLEPTSYVYFERVK